MQAAPCAALLSQLPELVTATAEPLESGVPLNDLLAADPGSLSITLTASSHAAQASTSQPAVVVPPSLASATAQEQVRRTAASSTPRSGEKTRGGDGVQASGEARWSDDGLDLALLPTRRCTACQRRRSTCRAVDLRPWRVGHEQAQQRPCLCVHHATGRHVC